MSKIYLPVSISSNNCVVVQDSNTIRVYDDRPNHSGTFSYRDYYPHLDYLYKEGSSTYGNMQTNYPQCVTGVDFTTSYWYDLRLVDSVTTFGFIFIIFCFLIKFLGTAFFRGLFK